MMKQISNSPFVFVLLCFLIASCVKDPILTLNTPGSISFSNQGGSQSISFETNREWTVSSSETWCKVAPYSGPATEGMIAVNLTCDPNTSYDPRSAILKIRAGGLVETITVNQDTNLGLFISPSSYDLTYAAQTIEVEVLHNVYFDVVIPDNARDWIEVVSNSGTRGLSASKVSLSIALNEALESREASITFYQVDGSRSETLVIRQGGLALDNYPYITFAYSSWEIPSFQIAPDFAKWTIYWGDGQFSHSPGKTDHTFVEEGIHNVLLYSTEITDFTVSAKGLEMIDFSNFE